MASKKIVQSADGASATLTDATLSDVFTTVLSTDTALTGTMALVQKVGLFVGGMAAQNMRLGQGLNPFKG